MASKEPIPLYFFRRTPSEKKYSPGASVVAASKEPIMTWWRQEGISWNIKWGDYKESDDQTLVLPVDAPRARAFTTCPTVWIPPSAITGTPKRRAYSATLYTDVPWGRPHAITAHYFSHKLSLISDSERINEPNKWMKQINKLVIMELLYLPGWCRWTHSPCPPSEHPHQRQWGF